MKWMMATDEFPARPHATDDRVELKDLIDRWAHCADRRLAHEQAQLFIEDCSVTVYAGNPDTHQPAQHIRGRHDLEESLYVLNRYEHTTHFNGQSTITINGDRAHGESYCLAHHLWTGDNGRMLTVMSIRYLDTFAKTSNQWLFTARILIIDWTDTRRSDE